MSRGKPLYPGGGRRKVGTYLQGMPARLLDPESKLYSLWRCEQSLMSVGINGRANGYHKAIADGDDVSGMLTIPGAPFGVNANPPATANPDIPRYDAAEKSCFFNNAGTKWGVKTEVNPETAYFRFPSTYKDDDVITGATLALSFRLVSPAGAIQPFFGNKALGIGGGFYLQVQPALTDNPGKAGIEFVTYDATTPVAASFETDRLEFVWPEDEDPHELAVICSRVDDLTIHTKMYFDRQLVAESDMTRGDLFYVSSFLYIGSDGDDFTYGLNAQVYGWLLALAPVPLPEITAAMDWVNKRPG